MGAIAFQKDLGATHSLAHPLSTEFGLNHGLANALCLPAVMRFCIEPAATHYARLASIFGANTQALTPIQAAEKAISEVEALIARLGIRVASATTKSPPKALTRYRSKLLKTPATKPISVPARKPISSRCTKKAGSPMTTTTNAWTLINPATEVVFRTVEPTSDAELDSILTRMRAAQQLWRDVPIAVRMKVCPSSSTPSAR